MDDNDLFADLREQRIRSSSPLASRLRPTHLDDIVGQDHLVGPGSPLRGLIEADKISAVILWGPPGTGKTTIARLIADHTDRAFVSLSALSAGVKDIREVIASAQNRLMTDQRGTVVFIDEIHRFSSTQQDSLLHAVETGIISLVGATTENPAFSVNPALRSRTTVFSLLPVSTKDMCRVIHRASESVGAVVDADAVELLAHRSSGDARQALMALEVAIVVANGAVISPEHVSVALQSSMMTMSTDSHYDVASAFIKSMRASDVDVALHWLAVMIESGEDPSFIARRLVIFASEDIGVADPMSLSVAVAAASALNLVGMPEATHHLAHAVIHLSQAPKSRAVTEAIGRALVDVRQAMGGQAPPTTAQPPEFKPRGRQIPQYFHAD